MSGRIFSASFWNEDAWVEQPTAWANLYWNTRPGFAGRALPLGWSVEWSGTAAPPCSLDTAGDYYTLAERTSWFASTSTDGWWNTEPADWSCCRVDQAELYANHRIELASKANMSPSTFRQYFRDLTGSSPLQYQSSYGCRKRVNWSWIAIWMLVRPL